MAQVAGRLHPFSQSDSSGSGEAAANLHRVCFPSQEEGIARAQIEALAAGLPIIGTFEGGTTTLVEDGIEGYIVRGRDPQHIAEAMLRVARDPELGRRMGEAAHKRARRRTLGRIMATAC